MILLKVKNRNDRFFYEPNRIKLYTKFFFSNFLFLFILKGLNLLVNLNKRAEVAYNVRHTRIRFDYPRFHDKFYCTRLLSFILNYKMITNAFKFYRL